MFCENCGSQLDPNSKFCSNCGAGTDAVAQTSHATTALPKSSAPDHSSPGKISDAQAFLPNLLRAKSKRRLYLGICFLAIAIIILISQSNYISNIFSGPRSIGPTALESELLSGHIKDWNISLHLDPNAVYGTGWVWITNEVNQDTNQVESTTTNKEYFGTVLGQHLLILENAPGQTPSGDFQGIIKPFPTGLRDDLINDFNSDPSLQGLNAGSRLLPYMLSNDNIFSMDNFGYIIAALIFLVWGAILFLRRITDSEDRKHYIYRIAKSAGYGNIGELSEDFVASMNQMNAKISSYQLTTKFLFKEKFFSLKIYPLSELFWIYKKVTSKRRSFSSSQTPVYYSAVLNFKSSKKIEIGGSEKQINDFLLALAALRPGIKVGYTQ